MLEASEEETMEETMDEDYDCESLQTSDNCPDWPSEENCRGPPPGGFRTWIAYRAAQAKKEHAYHEAQAQEEGMTMEQYWRAWGSAQANGAPGAADAIQHRVERAQHRVERAIMAREVVLSDMTYTIFHF